MNDAVNVFLASLGRVRSIHAVYSHFAERLMPAIDLSDILRAEIVLIVSALGQFVHEITRIGMMEVWRGARMPAPAYQKFSVSLEVTALLCGGVPADSHLETEIRTKHGFISFQQPEKIAEAIRHFCATELWIQVGRLMDEDPAQLKARLKLLVERRNKIAHEADIDPTFPGQRWPIAPRDTEDALSFIERLGEAIYETVADAGKLKEVDGTTEAGGVRS